MNIEKSYNDLEKALLPPVELNLEPMNNVVNKLTNDLKNNNCSNFIFWDGMTYKKNFFTPKKFYSISQNKFISKKEYNKKGKNNEST